MKNNSISYADNKFIEIQYIVQVFKRDKKSNQQIKQLAEFIHSFKPLSLLRKHKTNNQFRYLFQQLTLLNTKSKQIFYKKEEQTQNIVWFLAAGKIQITIQYNVLGQKTQQIVYLKPYQSFGYKNKIFLKTEDITLDEKYKKYEVTAIQQSTLFYITSTKLQQYLSSSQFSSQIAKRNFICQVLKIDDQQLIVKTFIKKFTSKQYKKNNLIFPQTRCYMDFMILKKGDVEIFKQEQNQDKKKIKIKLGILTPGSFLNDFRIGSSCFSTSALSEVEVLIILKHQLYKFFNQIPCLEKNLIKIIEQQNNHWLKIIQKHHQKPRYLSQIDQPKFQITIPLFKKNGLAFRNQKSALSSEFLGLRQYDQIVQNQQKVFVPLNRPKPVKNTSLIDNNQRRYKNSQIKKMLKKQKMDKIRVKKLAQKRIHGVQENQITVQLKPTIFKQSISVQHERQGKKSDQRQGSGQRDKDYNPFNLSDTGLINSLSKNTLNYKKNIMCLKQSKNKLSHSKNRTTLNSTNLLKQILKDKYEFKYVAPPRNSYQVDLNKAFDSLILTHSRNGRIRKMRVHLNS